MTIITHGVVLSAPANNPDAPRVGFRNLFREGTVTVSSEHAAHPKDLAFDGFTYDGWEPIAGGTQWIAVEVSPAEAADHMAVAAHTLAGCTLTPQSSTDGTSWTDLAAEFMPADNRPIVWEFTEAVAAHFRLLVENAPGPFSVGAIHAGPKLEMARGMPAGWKPPSLNEKVEYTNVMSHGGQILGRQIVRRGVEAQVESSQVEYTWAREDWLEFIEAAATHAFFFWWTYEGLGEVVYGGLESHDVAFADALRVTTRFTLAGINR